MRLRLFILMLVISICAMGRQPCPEPPCPPDPGEPIPITGLEILLVGGAALGIDHFRRKKNKK